jgi:hypothetical protein
MVSITVLVAGDRGIIIDSVASELGVDVWEIGFGVYLMFMIAGVIYDMVSDTGKFNPRDDFGDIIMVTLLSIFSYVGLSVIAVGSISGAVIAMQNENVGWSTMYAVIIAVYMANKFLVKR